jgi:predicted secreted protein
MAQNPRLAKDLVVLYGGKAIARAKSYNFEVNKQTVDVTTFDSDGWKEFLVDLKEWKFSVSGLITRENDEDNNFDDMLSAIIGSDSTAIVMLVDSESGIADIRGSAYVIKLSAAGDVGGEAKADYEFQGTGKLEVADYS